MKSSITKFCDEWERVKADCRELSRFSSGLDKGIEEKLAEISTSLESCIKEAEEKSTSRVLPLIKGFNAEVRLDLENIRTLKKLMERLSSAEEEFKRLREKLKEYEARAYEACREYFERQQEYVRALTRTRETTKQAIGKIKTEFLERVKEATSGYSILVSGMPCSAGELFEELLRGNLGAIELVPKTRKFFAALGGEEEAIAKREVVDYLVKEAEKKIAPVLREEQRSIERIEALFPDLRGLEKACKEAEELREQASQPLEGLRKEMVEIRRNRAYAYSTEEKIQELRRKYLDKIKKIEEVIKE
jgi:chromosome segregation ATPase